MDNVLTIEDINRAIKALEKGPSYHFTAEDVKEFMDRVEKSMRFGINDFPEFEIYRGKKDFSGIKINTDRLKPKAGFGCMNLRCDTAIADAMDMKVKQLKSRMSNERSNL